MKRILYSIFLIILGFVSGTVFIIYRCGYLLENKQKRADKYFAYFNLLDQWLICKEQGRRLSDYFHKNGWKTAAIYGMGKMGKHLQYELEQGGVEISYVIDEGESVIYGKEEHYNLQDKLPVVDVVIVTPVKEFEDIKDKILADNGMLHVISLSELVGKVKAGIL